MIRIARTLLNGLDPGRLSPQRSGLCRGELLGAMMRGVSAAEVMDLACRVLRDDAAYRWMQSPNQDLNDETPLEVIEQGGEERVIALLLALAEGITA